MLENSGLVGYAQEVLKETDQSCFVQTAKQLHTRQSQVTVKRLWNFHRETFPVRVGNLTSEITLTVLFCFVFVSLCNDNNITTKILTDDSPRITTLISQQYV